MVTFMSVLSSPLLFGGVPAIRLRHRGFGGLVLAPFDVAQALRQFGQIAQSFAAANSLSALSKLHSGLPERAVTDID
jgi:hypothetical protein